MAFLVQQAAARQVFLDQLDALARDAATTEAVLHTALERNLWVFGAEYSLFSSNSTLRRQVEDIFEKTYSKSPVSDVLPRFRLCFHNPSLIFGFMGGADGSGYLVVVPVGFSYTSYGRLHKGRPQPPGAE
jgi:hypothetical protein